MHRSITLAAALTITAVATALPGQAGTAADPEITDAAGDATWVHAGGTNADWADLTGVWFTSSAPDEPTAFTVNIGVVGGLEQPDQDAAFLPSWETFTDDGVRCVGELFVWVEDIDGDAWSRQADLTYRCDGESQPFTVPLLDVTVDLPGSFQGVLPVDDTGNVVQVTVPLSAFTEGLSAGLYQPGTVLHPQLTTSVVLFETGGVGTGTTVDGTQHPCEGDSLPTGDLALCFSARDYVIGS